MNARFERCLGVGVGIFVVALAGCGGGTTERGDGEPVRESRGEVECVEPSGSLPAGATLRGRAGEYTLVMIGGAEGARPGSVQGGLVLLPQTAEMATFRGVDGNPIPGVTSPLYGTTDIELQEVGALRIGALGTADPAAPGVLAIESQTARGPSILLRFGSNANSRDMGLFDGGFTVLEVREMGEDGFRGTWNSGAQGSRTSGYFCITRATD